MVINPLATATMIQTPYSAPTISGAVGPAAPLNTTVNTMAPQGGALTGPAHDTVSFSYPGVSGQPNTATTQIANPHYPLSNSSSTALTDPLAGVPQSLNLTVADAANTRYSPVGSVPPVQANPYGFNTLTPAAPPIGAPGQQLNVLA
ncbi:MAG: hypothetical protein U0003_04435 [Vampirovibrionales bacterium]